MYKNCISNFLDRRIKEKAMIETTVDSWLGTKVMMGVQG